MRLQILKIISIFVAHFAIFNAVLARESLQELSPQQKILLENRKARALASFAKALSVVEEQYVDPETVDIDAMVDKALSAMLSGLDPHSGYLSSKQFKKFSNADAGNSRAPSVILHDLSHQIAYLKLSIFDTSSYLETKNRLIEFQSNHSSKIQGLVLDLRDNPGGLFEQSIQIANLFIDSGILVSTVGRNQDKLQQVEYAMTHEKIGDFPMIVLVNDKTASSSEILAGALQDHDRALIMGETTYGKGSVQKVVPLPNGGAIKFTVARYYTPSGRSLQAEGVIPDVMFIPYGEGKIKNHIQNKLWQIGTQKKSFYQEIDEWNTDLRRDEILRQAYLYLRQAL